MHRISITYENVARAPFNWDYYMNNHLPLAVGTSMRHSGLNFCDADKPMNDDSPNTCVCMVHFDNAQSMVDFCNFFVKGHPESKRIDNDEKNYTTIAPNMVAAEYQKFDLVNKGARASHRLKIFFPFVEIPEDTRDSIIGDLKGLLSSSAAAAVSAEVDFCTSGIVPGSEPDYSLIWAISFNSQREAEGFHALMSTSENTHVLKELIKVEPQYMLSEIMPFDMALTDPYRLAE